MRAPIAGVITARNIEVGYLISSNGGGLGASPASVSGANTLTGNEMFRIADTGTVRACRYVLPSSSESRTMPCSPTATMRLPARVASSSILLVGAGHVCAGLALQVATECSRIAQYRDISVVPIYGGAPMYAADIERALQVMGSRFVQIYGQGETPMTGTVRWPRFTIACSAGKIPVMSPSAMARPAPMVR